MMGRRVNPFERKRTVFKDASTFDQGWTPNWEEHELPCRERELDSLTSLYYPVIESGGSYSINSLILGRGGVGKTVTAKYFARMFKDAAISKGMNCIIEYIDCNEHSTRNAILRELLKRFKLSNGRGYSDPELMKQLIAYIFKTRSYLFTILDEIHNLKQEDLLSFLNASITFGSKNVRMSFLCISRSSDWLNYSTERITSRIQKIYNFKWYTYEEALKILKFRHKLAFYADTFPEDVLKMIARICEDEKNVRVGLEIMREVALHLDENGLSQATPEMIRLAGKELISNYDTDLLNYLKNTHEYLILLAIARYFKYNEDTYMTTSQIYENYSAIAEEYNQPKLKFATMKRYLLHLENIKLIRKEYGVPEGKDRGRESRYYLTDFSAEVLEDQINKMLNELFK
ncbi:MAG: Cdc6/Cdc18 family protein [Promethearchaeota archaeon]